MQIRTIAAIGAAALFGLGVIAEVGVRLAGLTDVPLYSADNHIGYIPAPSQSGSFMDSHDWAFNELSMGTAEPFRPDERTDILLIGDSVVLGGNPYRQGDRLGPQLAQATGDTVWPISAGSWALQNELTWLEDHPAVLASVDRIVFVLNGGDFGEPSSWRSELTHPRSRPFSAAAYLASKYVLKPRPPAIAPDMAVRIEDWRKDFAAMAAATDAPIIVLLYPDRAGKDDTSPGRELLALGADRIVDLAADPRWNDTYYRDDIHPSPAGTAVLARIIQEGLGPNLGSGG